ncbi:hypothetical protein YC2023_112796 [Brassica napus]
MNKIRGFLTDQLTLTASASKAGFHRWLKKLSTISNCLGQPLDYRSYGSMIMAYIRACHSRHRRGFFTRRNELSVRRERERERLTRPFLLL